MGVFDALTCELTCSCSCIDESVQMYRSSEEQQIDYLTANEERDVEVTICESFMLQSSLYVETIQRTLVNPSAFYLQCRNV